MAGRLGMAIALIALQAGSPETTDRRPERDKGNAHLMVQARPKSEMEMASISWSLPTPACLASKDGMANAD